MQKISKISRKRKKTLKSPKNKTPNRVPLVHSINNGFSSITMPDGKVIFKTPYEKTGAWVFEMPFDKNSGGSFYSKHYNWFANLIRIFIFGIVGFVLIKAVTKKKFTHE